MEKTERVRINDTDYPLLGTLLIEPFDRKKVDIIDTQIDLGSPSSTISPTTSSSTATGGNLITDMMNYFQTSI